MAVERRHHRDLERQELRHHLIEKPGECGAALFGIASGPAGVVVAWEERRKRTQGSRRVYLARTTEAGVRESKPYVVELAGKGAFELAATPAGFVFLADRRTCEPGGAAQGSCTGPIAPMVTRLSRDMDPTSAEIVEDAKGPKIKILKFKNKTGYRKRQGHRQHLTRIKVTGIEK